MKYGLNHSCSNDTSLENGQKLYNELRLMQQLNFMFEIAKTKTPLYTVCVHSHVAPMS